MHVTADLTMATKNTACVSIGGEGGDFTFPKEGIAPLFAYMLTKHMHLLLTDYCDMFGNPGFSACS